MLRRVIFSAFSLLIGLSLMASTGGDPQKRFTRTQYIDLWKDEAIKQMREYKIPASITLAQAILESGDGNSELARKANNHFGIKCHKWTGKKTYHDDDKRNECFRKYDSASQSFEDHSLFLQRSRYAFLFELKITDYKGWAKGLKKAGYATNPKYPALLIRLIEENNLTQYDKMALDKGYDPKDLPVASETPSKSGDEIVVNVGQRQTVYLSDNNIKYIVAETDQSAERIAENLNMGSWQIRKYNDLDKNERIEKGDRIYIQPKRNKSKKYETHVVATGETIESISQIYGVKVKKILKHSGLPKDYKAKPGDTIRLKGKGFLFFR
jgi:LysM repeat protein